MSLAALVKDAVLHGLGLLVANKSFEAREATAKSMAMQQRHYCRSRNLQFRKSKKFLS